MSERSLEIYAERARTIDDPWLASARYDDQRDSREAIVEDVRRKLQLNYRDVLFDIGCGVGVLTIPLSWRCHAVVAIDHRDCLARLVADRPGGDQGLVLIPGNFLQLNGLERIADKVLVYDVLHYLRDESEFFAFVGKAVRLLKIGGIALFGDIPTRERRQRWLRSAIGRRSEVAWRAKSHDDGSGRIHMSPDTELVEIDERMLETLQATLEDDGYIMSRASQPKELPFSNTRQDIIVRWR